MLNFFAITGIALGSTGTIMAILMLWKAKNFLHRLWALFCVSTIFWGWGAFKIATTSNIETADLWWRITHIGVIFIPILFTHFIYQFLKIKRRWFLISIYSLGIFFLVSNFIGDLFIANMRWVFNQFYYDSPPGILYTPFTFFFFSLVIYSHYELWMAYRKASGITKSQIKFFFFGMAISFSGGSLSFLPVYKIDVYPALNLLASFYPIIIGYTITRYRLMDIRLAVKKSAVFLTSFILSVVIAVFVWLGIDAYIDFPAKIGSVVSASVGIIIFLPIREFLRILANKYLFASLYSQHNTIRSLSQKLTTIIDLDELTDSVTKTIARALGTEGVAFLLQEAETTAYRLERIIGFKEDNGLSLIKDTNLINQLQETAKPLVYEELSGGLKKSLGRLEARLCLPLISKKKLVGIIVLGQKRSGDAYSKEDLDLLESLAIQTSLAIENSRLYDQIKDLNNNLEDKVKEQTKNIIELYKMKSDFLDTASHQLRTPTSIFRGMLSLLGEEGKKQLNPKQKELLQNSIQASDRLSHIIDGIMEANELQGGILKEKLQSVDIEKVIEEAIASEDELAREKKLAVEFKRSKTKPPLIIGHYAFIKSALQKIINNSLWYTQAGTITIRASYQEKDKTTAKDDTISVIISDTGLGLSPEDKMILFKQFSKGRGAHLTNPNSSGLGLYIAKRVAELHNGSLSAESAGENQGATFTLSLPVVQRV